MVINFTTLLRPYGGKIKDFAFMSFDIDELYGVNPNGLNDVY